MRHSSPTGALLACVALLATGCGPLVTERTDEYGLTALMRAAGGADTVALLALLARNADVNSHVPPRDFRDAGFISQLEERPRQTVGFTALHFAARAKRLHNARILIAHGADVGRRGNYGVTPLNLAIMQNDAAMAELLARAGARPEAQLAGLAVGKRSRALVAALYANGANPNQAARVDAASGPKPLLIIATQRGDPEIVRTLLAARADVDARDARGWSALRWAYDAKSRNQKTAGEIIALLEGAGARDDAGLAGLRLLQAVTAGDVAGVRAALAAGADPNSRDPRGITPLIHAAQSGHARIAEALVARGAHVDFAPAYHVTALTAAIERGDPAMARLLLAAGARGDHRDGRGMEPLHLTAMFRRADIAALILADTTVTPKAWHLNEASRQGDLAQVAALLDRGLDANVTDGVALNSAARGCADRDAIEPVIRLLLQRGARPGHSRYRSPLHLAAGRCPPAILALLLQHGDSVNGRDWDGSTPLIVAATRGRADNVRALIAAGADVHAKDANGGTAYSHARDSTVREVLLGAGAKADVPSERTGIRTLLARFR